MSVETEIEDGQKAIKDYTEYQERRTLKYRSVFLQSEFGKWVLSDIIETICGLSGPATSQEIGTKQSIAKEILCAVDIWFGEGQEDAEKFINKLARERT